MRYISTEVSKYLVSGVSAPESIADVGKARSVAEASAPVELYQVETWFTEEYWVSSVTGMGYREVFVMPTSGMLEVYVEDRAPATDWSPSHRVNTGIMADVAFIGSIWGLQWSVSKQAGYGHSQALAVENHEERIVIRRVLSGTLTSKASILLDPDGQLIGSTVEFRMPENGLTCVAEITDISSQPIDVGSEAITAFNTVAFPDPKRLESLAVVQVRESRPLTHSFDVREMVKQKSDGLTLLKPGYGMKGETVVEVQGWVHPSLRERLWSSIRARPLMATLSTLGALLLLSGIISTFRRREK